MAQWYEVFDRVTGEVVSVATVVADPLPVHLDKRLCADPQTLAPNPNIAILAQIDKLERGQVRAVREFYISGSKVALQNLETKIVALRGALK